ncbi:MAG TPA: YtxH domain-containing protein [Patescibacteria group bacterium]
MAKSNGKLLFAGIIGALAGALGGLLLAPQSGKETRDEIAKLAKDLANKIKTEADETRERVKEVFGSASSSAMAKYSEVRQAVVDKVAAVKTAGQDIDKDKYQMIVDDVVAEYKDDLDITKEAMTKLSNQFKKDWTKIKKAVTAPAEK